VAILFKFAQHLYFFSLQAKKIINDINEPGFKLVPYRTIHINSSAEACLNKVNELLKYVLKMY